MRDCSRPAACTYTTGDRFCPPLSLSLSHLCPSLTYLPLDKSISPLPPGEGQICSANIIRKIEKSKHDPNVAIYVYISLSLSPRRDIVTRTKTCLSVSNVDISSLARFSRVLKILESSSDIPGKKKRTGTGYKLLNISQSYFFPIVEGNKRGLVDPRGCERVAGNHVSTKRLVSLLLLPLPQSILSID